MVKSSGGRKISAAKAAAGVERLQSDALLALQQAQYTYIEEKLRADPSLLVRIIAVIDGQSGGSAHRGRKFFSQSIRKFHQLPKLACIATMENLIGTLSQHYEADSVPLQVMRFLIIWALEVDGTIKIPSSCREKADWLRWTLARASLFSNKLEKHFRLPFNGHEDMLFRYGCYVLEIPDDWNDVGELWCLPTVIHTKSGTKRDLPDAVRIYKGKLADWCFENNHNDAESMIVNRVNGISFFLKKLFKDEALGLPKAMYLM